MLGINKVGLVLLMFECTLYYTKKDQVLFYRLA